MVCKVPSVLVSVLLWLVVSVASVPSAVEEPKVQKLTFGSGGVNRTYDLFVPEKAAAGHAPLLLLLHGSGRNGKTLVDPWLPLAKSEGIVLVAPDASNPQAWRIPEDGPDFFHNLAAIAAHAGAILSVACDMARNSCRAGYSFRPARNELSVSLSDTDLTAHTDTFTRAPSGRA